MIRLAAAAALALAPIALALAPIAASAQSADGPGLAFTLGVCVEAVPDYFGSD